MAGATDGVADLFQVKLVQAGGLHQFLGSRQGNNAEARLAAGQYHLDIHKTTLCKYGMHCLDKIRSDKYNSIGQHRKGDQHCKTYFV